MKFFFFFRRQLYLAKDSIVDSQGEQRPLGFFGSKILALM